MGTAAVETANASDRSRTPNRQTPRQTPRQRRGAFALVALTVLLVAMMMTAAGIGAVPISVGQVVEAIVRPLGIPLSYGLTEQQDLVFWAIRFPRVIFAALVGATLAAAGAALQGVFRNPLADPSLIGIANGASMAAAGAFVFGESWIISRPLAMNLLVPVTAFAGALTATYVVLRLSRVGRRTVVTTMLLVGIAINALAGAGIGIFTYFATDQQLRSLTFWNLGSLGGATWPILAVTAPMLLLAILVLPRFARALNLLLLGEAEARHLGINVDRVKRAVVVLAALGVGVSVAFAGVIVFVGLVVPHLLRLMLGPDNRYVLTFAPLLGASLLVGADLVARTLVAPAELPIGIVTAAIGAPFFLWLVVRQRGTGASL